MFVSSIPVPSRIQLRRSAQPSSAADVGKCKGIDDLDADSALKSRRTDESYKAYHIAEY